MNTMSKWFSVFFAITISTLAMPFLAEADIAEGEGTETELYLESDQSDSEQADLEDQDDLFDLSLEELSSISISSASFFTTTTRKAPGYTMVYDMEKINLGPARTLADIFDMYVPGTITGAHERQGRLLGTRGIMLDNNAKTLFMWDGQQINYRMHFGYMVGLYSPFMGDISKIEVIHGPGAIIHGSGAINGFVNMIPKTGTSHPGGFARYEYGFKEYSKLIEAGYGLSYGENRDLYIYGGTYAANGFEPDLNWGTTHSYSEDMDAFGYGTDNHRMSAVWNHDNFSLNVFNYELKPQKNSANEYGFFMNETLGIRPKYTFEISDTDSFELSGSAVWLDYGDRGANASRAPLYGGSEHHWDTKGVYRTTAIENHQIAFGAIYGRKYFNSAQFYFDDNPGSGFESINNRWDEMGLFAEDVITITDCLTLSLGIRYDKYYTEPINDSLVTEYHPEISNPDPGKIPGHTSPRIALAYELDKETTIKASYQHGFRMPDAIYYNWNLFNNAAASALGYSTSPLLTPEEMDSYELNIEKIVDEKLTINNNIFYNVFRDQLSWGPLENYWTADQVDAINHWTPASSWGWGGGMFQNISGDFVVYGDELIADYKLTEETNVNASYSWAKAENNYIEQRYPSHQVKAGVTTRLFNDKLMLGLNYTYSSSYDYDINPNINDAYKDTRNVVDLSAVYVVNKNLRIKGIARNIFSETTPAPGYLMNQPAWGNMGYDEPKYYLSAELLF